MRSLKRNQTPFEYLPLVSEGDDLNKNDEHTGEYSEIEYGDPVPYMGSFSMPSGYANQAFYGMNIRYTHILTLDRPDFDIKENGLIRWNGDLYEIRAVRPSLNFMNIALRKQTENHADGDV